MNDSRLQAAFLTLVGAQAAHSIEEYVFELYAVFAPARVVSSLFSADIERGFVIANLLLVGFGFWCYVFRVRRGGASARAWVWPWVILEGANGCGHILFAVERSGYFPGVYTAPVLLGVSIYLAAKLARGG